MKNLKDAVIENLTNNFSIEYTEKDAQTEEDIINEQSLINLSLNSIEFINDEIIDIKYVNRNLKRLTRNFKFKNIDVNLKIE